VKIKLKHVNTWNKTMSNCCA